MVELCATTNAGVEYCAIEFCGISLCNHVTSALGLLNGRVQFLLNIIERICTKVINLALLPSPKTIA